MERHGGVTDDAAFVAARVAAVAIVQPLGFPPFEPREVEQS